MDQAVTTPSARSASSTVTLDRLAPYALSIWRIMAALLFVISVSVMLWGPI